MADSKAEALGLKPVKTAEVCMVNNAFMGKAQIPVKINGKTYYGCCKNCAKRLKGERSARYSKDPLTGKEVDKAAAFIAAKPDGDVLYFESEETAHNYGVESEEGQTHGH
ncbi:TRASH domain-containing protein [bacterium]|nr:MAG: TRASH domain-containing protein [bacterium]